MTRVALTGGSYEARSVIASAVRSVNVFAEKNPTDAASPLTYYGCPGLTPLASPPVSFAGRGLYWANNDTLYYVSGRAVFEVSPTWALSQIGTINTDRGRVSMIDNGTTLVIVDGSPFGWQIDLATNAFSGINSSTNGPDPPVTGAVYAFFGADRVDVIDGFILLNQPGTRNFYSTLLNEVKFDALFFAAKNGYSDNLVSLIVIKREIWLIGERTTEIWFDAGAPDFPFQIMPGPFIQHGCIAKASVAQANGSAFWLSQDQNGQAIVVRTEGYDAKRISNFALENAMAKYPTVTDAEGFTFQQRGHTFYQINFPTADRSWRWDETVPDQWHEPVWTDTNGVEHRHRASCSAFAYGKNVVADWETGQLYALDPENHTDAGAPMHYRRGFPHMVGDGKQVIYPGFTLDVEAATGLDTIDPPGPFPLLTGASGVNAAPSIDSSSEVASSFTTNYVLDGFGNQVLDGFGNPVISSVTIHDGTVLFEEALFAGPAPQFINGQFLSVGIVDNFGNQITDSHGNAIIISQTNAAAKVGPPLVYLRWSDDRGRTFGNPIGQSLGAQGQYLTQPQWSRLGRARDRIFEVYGVIPGKFAIQGAWLDPAPIVMES
jgi:hypothetical protein